MFNSSDRSMLGLTDATAAVSVPRGGVSSSSSSSSSGNFIPSSSSSNLNSDTLTAALYSNYSYGDDSAASAGRPNLITPSSTPTDFSDTLSPTIVDVASSAAVARSDTNPTTTTVVNSIPALSEIPNSSSVGTDGVSHHARPDTLHPTLLPAGRDHPEPSEWRIQSQSSSTSSSFSSYGGGYPTSASTSATATAIDMTGIEMLIRAAASTTVTEYQPPPPSPTSPRPVIVEYQYPPRSVINDNETDDDDVRQDTLVVRDTIADSITGLTTKKRKNPTTLYTPEDDEELRKLHCFLRKVLELYEVMKNEEDSAVGTTTNDDDDDDESYDPSPPAKKRRRTKTAKAAASSNTEEDASADTATIVKATTTASNNAKRLGLRCLFCKQHWHAPKSLDEKDFYIKIMPFRKNHFEGCPSVPQVTMDEFDALKNGKDTRGRKNYWEKSAKKIGLVNIVDRAGRPAGIKFAE